MASSLPQPAKPVFPMNPQTDSPRPLEPISGRAIATALGPRPIAIVGTSHNGRANFTPAAFCTPLSYHPPLIALGLKPTSFGYETLTASGRCTIATVGAEEASRVLWCGSHSGRDTDKSKGFHAHWTAGEAPLPYPESALTVLEARVTSITEAGDHQLIILEIKSAQARPSKTGSSCLSAEGTLLCLEHGVFAVVNQLA